MNPDYLTKCDRLFDLTQEICQEEIKERPKAQRTKLEPKPKRPKLDTSPVDVAGPSSRVNLIILPKDNLSTRKGFEKKDL